MAEDVRFIEVALGLPLRKIFTYEVPEAMRASVVPGKRVWVPFGRRFLSGFVLGPAQDLPSGKKILPIRCVVDDEVTIPANLLHLLIWTARYYFQPIGEVIKTALPAGSDLRPRECYRITEEGREAHKNLSPRSPQREFLQSLIRQGGKGLIPASLFGPEVSGKAQSLRQMTAEGWIQKEEDSFAPVLQAKRIRFVRFRQDSPEARLSPEQREVLDFLHQAGDYPLRELQDRFPKGPLILRQLARRRLVEMYDREHFRQPLRGEVEGWENGPPDLLTPDQQNAIAAISQAFRSRRGQAFLLHGVTGSGKTEVYLRAIEEVLKAGLQALLLVPEIALTGQLVAYFQSRIRYPMAILHSALSPGERYDEWRRIRKGLAQLVIGVRSAIFAPLEHPGMIIVDEEHDPSFKQEEKVRYHARDLALVRGKMENAVVILGSATPSLESYYNAMTKKFRLLSLPRRIEDRPLPEVQVLDMRLEATDPKARPILSQSLEESLQQNALRGEQAILFLNRRGFSTFSLCPDCGFTYKCPNCSVSLTYHLPQKSFRCHYCDYSLPSPDRCPTCASTRIRLFGLGTQRLEEEIQKKFPHIRLTRMDRDTTTRKSAHQNILSQVRRGDVNLLIGTQMITKGHDLPRVTLVGVLAADLSLNVPDFRASERTFQLLTQVSGRAGRGTLPGKVIIQTYNPRHYSIRMAQAQDYSAFYREEMKFRQEMDYPPFVRLVNLRLEGNSAARVQESADSLAGIAAKVKRGGKKFQGEVEILGPAVAPLAKLKGKIRYQMLLKGRNWSVLHDYLERLLQQAEKQIPSAGIRLTVDVDPVGML
jgi:primosomal protein N' (replication factor Y)